MKKNAWIPICCLLGLLCQAETADKRMQCITLNNEGVKAINSKDWQLAFEKFEAVLKLDPDYSLARDNLAVMHGQHGIQLRQEHRLADALKEFQQAAYIKPYWNSAVSETIRKNGGNPDSFGDRVELADQASANKDYVGAAVEYSAALKVKDDPQTHKKLADVYGLLNDKDKATVEYAAAHKDIK